MRYDLRFLLFSTILSVSAMPMLILGLVASNRQADSALADNEANSTSIAYFVARETTRIVEERVENVEGLAAHAIPLVNADRVILQRHVDAHATGVSGFSAMYVANAAGRSMAIWPERNGKGEKNWGVDYSDRDYFKEAKLRRTTSLSKVQIGKRSGVPNIQIGAPILDSQGTFLGLAEGSVDLAVIQAMVVENGRDLQDLRISISDEEGNLVADSSKGEIHELDNVGEFAAFAPSPGAGEVRRAVDEQGQMMLVASVSVPVAGRTWLVAVMRAERVVLESADRAKRQTLRATLLACLLSLFVAAVLAYFLSNPIVRLAQFVHQAHSGVGSHPLPRFGRLYPTEIRDLTAAFGDLLNRMRQQSERLEDAVDQKTIELSFADQRARMLVGAVECAGEAIWILGRGGDLLYVNQAFVQMTGYRLADLRSERGRWLGAPDDVAARNDAAITAGQWNTTRVVQRKSGEAYDQEVAVSVVDGSDDGHDRAYIFVGRDVTSRRRREADLREKELAVLQSANQELIEAAGAQGQFVARMSHELRTPLNAILGLAETLVQGVYGDASTKQIEALERIELSGQILLELINNILRLRVLGESEKARYFTPIFVNEVGRKSVEAVAAARNNAGIQLEFNASKDAAYVMGDSTLVQGILVHILHNAIKFSPSGGRITLDCVVESETNVVEFVITDQGIGISERDQKDIFRPFFQVDRDLDRHYDGSGLGLALVARYVDLHQGEVKVESQLGRGTKVRVVLPRVAGPLPDSSSLNGTQHVSRVIAITMDSDVVAALKEMGLEVVEFGRGAGALEAVVQSKADFIVVDALLPDMSARFLIEELQRDERTSALPLIHTTDRSEPMFEADAQITRPFRQEHVLSVFEKLRVPLQRAFEQDSGESRLVLIVDDNPGNVEHLKDFLGFTGFEVAIAENGGDAIEMTRRLKPAVVLMDIQMPGVSGIDAIEEIRKDPELAAVKIIALTALAMESDRRTCLDAGADSYISKPFKLVELVREIDMVCNHGVPHNE
jgi:PAS domain S-box-containing protein